MSVRIVDLDAVVSLQNGDYIIVDNDTEGTHKFNAMNLGSNTERLIADTYSSSAVYAVGQYCMYNNNLYVCTSDILAPEAWNSAHWTQVTVGEELYDKVDKVNGKGLSTNDFTNTDKNKLDSIESGAEVNVQADWTEDNSSNDAYILNKPISDTTLEQSGGFADGQTVGLNFATTYSSSATYAVGDCVLYNGHIYVCKTKIAIAESWTEAHWTQTSIGAIFEAIVSGTEANAFYHLGFYLDENGDLNQIDD